MKGFVSEADKDSGNLFGLILVMALSTISYTSGSGAASGADADEITIKPVLITKTKVFDGQNEELSEGLSVLVKGN